MMPRRNRGIPLPRYWTHPSCGGCPFRLRSQGFTRWVGPQTAEVLFIGEAAGSVEVETGLPFMGGAGSVLGAFLAKAGLHREEVRIGNVVQCRPLAYEECQTCSGTGDDGECPACAGTGEVRSLNSRWDYVNAAPSPAQIRECMARHTRALLDGLTCLKLIVLLGETPLHALARERGITRKRGSVYQTEWGPALATFHPAFIMRAPTRKPFVEHDFSRIPALLGGRPSSAGIPPGYHRRPAAADLARVLRAEVVAADLETTGGQSPYTPADQIKCASASIAPGHATIVPLGELDRLMERTIIGQNFAYDMWWLHHKGHRVPEVVYDTMLMAHLANPSTPNNLYDIQSQYAEPPMEAYWKDDAAYAQDIELVAMRDADATIRSFRGLKRTLEQEGRWHLVPENIVPLTRMAHDMRVQGVRVDLAILDEEATRLEARVRALGRRLNELGVAVPRKSKLGVPSPVGFRQWLHSQRVRTKSVDKRSVGRMLRMASVPEAVKEALRIYQEMQDLYGQAKSYRKYELFGDRIHATLCIGRLDDDDRGGSRSGRLSYKDPSLHQVPKYVRRAFLPDPGKVFVQADAKQLEYVINLYAIGAWDALRQALVEGRDFHALTMNATGLDRANAKRFNFAWWYGASPENTAEILGIDVEAARALSARMHKAFPEREPWIRKTVDFARRNGYYQTEFGWRRYFDEFKVPEIINTPIQSNAALAVRYKLVELARELPKTMRIVLSVHDSILVEVPDDPAEVARAVRIIREVLGAPVPQLPCPQIGMPEGLRLRWDLETGPSWGEMTRC